MNTDSNTITKQKEPKAKKQTPKTDKMVGQKRKSSKRTGASSEDSLEDSNTLRAQVNEEDFDLSDFSDDDSSSTSN